MSKKCIWTQDKDDPYTHDTGCCNKHEFIIDGIARNKYKFCPYCGKKIREVNDE